MPERSVDMKYEYTVKLNGRKYFPGEEVPVEGQTPNVVEPKKEPVVEEKPVVKVEKKPVAKSKSAKGK